MRPCEFIFTRMPRVKWTFEYDLPSSLFGQFGDEKGYGGWPRVGHGTGESPGSGSWSESLIQRRNMTPETTMSETVADVLVSTLQQIGVKQIFALIGDSLNPLADAVRRSSIEWVGVRHEEGAALATPQARAKLTGRLAVCAPGPLARAALTLSPASMRPAAITPRSWHFQATCRGNSGESIIFRQPNQICYFAMLRSTPRPSRLLARLLQSFIRRLLPAYARDVGLPI